MQKLIYENLLGERITLGGAPPYILAGVSGLGPTETALVSTRGAYQNGATTRGATRTQRIVRARFSILGAQTRQAMYEARRAASRLLALPRCLDATTGAMGRLIYENDAIRCWTYAVPEASDTDGRRTDNALGELSVTFRCDSPYWSALAQEARVLRMGEGGLALPFTLPFALGTRAFTATCENDGAIDAPVRIEILGCGEKPALYNETTGAAIRLERAIASGERLIIETDPDRLSVTIAHGDGTRENAFGYLDAQCAVTAFVLRPGQNTLRYVPDQSAADSVITILWRSRQEGV